MLIANQTKVSFREEAFFNQLGFSQMVVEELGRVIAKERAGQPLNRQELELLELASELIVQQPE